MDGSRIKQAIKRIDAAASRIAAASDKLASPPTDGGALAQQHRALKTEVAATLEELDKLIEKFES